MKGEIIMKVIKYKDQKDGVIRITAYFKHKEFDKENKMISIPFGDGKSKIQPEYYWIVRKEFYNLDTYLRELSEIEDFFSYMEDEVEMDENDTGFDLPLPNDSREYFLIFNDKIWVYIIVYDEYGGFGSSDSALYIPSLFVPEGTSIEEVREVRDWFVKGGFKLNK